MFPSHLIPCALIDTPGMAWHDTRRLPPRQDLAQALVKRGVSLEALSAWSKVALKIVDSQVGKPRGMGQWREGSFFLLDCLSFLRSLLSRPFAHEAAYLCSPPSHDPPSLSHGLPL